MHLLETGHGGIISLVWRPRTGISSRPLSRAWIPLTFFTRQVRQVRQAGEGWGAMHAAASSMLRRDEVSWAVGGEVRVRCSVTNAEEG